MMWRHGDVMIAGVDQIPEAAKKQHSGVLVEGELTGHSHRIETPGTAEVWEHRGSLFLRVAAESARIVHEEHHPIVLPRGIYRVWQQREYSPGQIRRIAD